MSAEEIVLQLKRKGTFDELRKRLLADFQTEPAGQQFMKKIQDFMEDMITKDPSLLDKDKSAFHSLMLNEIEKTGMYQTIQKEIVTTLMQADDFQKRVEDEMNTVLNNL
ncbi:complex proteins associated with Set1p component shg1-domain-containing protein [Halteromyces radiatus]|uniref:complex proteins associated with Set1p component shg1-domain-containing protein n=1 Tax=Halteromyces radiatus TaxID=101107 RepID=UPI0022200F85|nr:complex proteins associated with Set1p component shg1-domain-containing protein [Halteromyces radiatus]KAI8098494.1 complex proteins associated with Set1p component shg1-domain-containing protein [Halteromyces radiatus]